jgi:dipeptidase
VPDDSIAVVANMFSVRQVNLSDSVNFLGSANMYAIAEKHGLWNASMGLLDFTATFSDGEYDHQYYSGRRMWGVYRLLAASQRLPSNYTNLKYDAVYPTFVKPDRPVAVTDIMNVHRDYYQGVCVCARPHGGVWLGCFVGWVVTTAGGWWLVAGGWWLVAGGW